MNNLTSITLHGILGEQVGKNWNIQIKSVSEAIHAINILSGQKLYKQLRENDEKNIKYKVLVNNNLIEPDKELKPDEIESIRNSEFCIEKKIDEIDIVPVLEGAGGDNGGTFAIIAGVLLIIAGILIIGVAAPIGAALIIGGVGLIAAGVYTLLSKPPEFEDFREKSERISYLFNGPTNVSREGGPVPVAYGRLIVGSQVASATYEITNTSSEDTVSRIPRYSI